MTIIKEIEEFTKSLPMDYEFTATWLKKELSKQYNRPDSSYIPSDYCYNRKNNGINYDNQPHYFIYLGRNKYKFVGKYYVYKGEIEHSPRKNF